MMEADLVKWIWANLPTLTVALILARVYYRALQIWTEQERKCKAHSDLIHRIKNVLLAEFPKRTRELLEAKDEESK
jgi:hypothetical protein